MFPRYFIAWFGMMALAILNGGFRQYAYHSLLGDLAAHQLSTLILIVLFTAYFLGVFRIWPVRTARQAWRIGGMWFLMTVVFELGMGRLLLGLSWGELLYSYNLFSGRVWVFVPVWVLVAPYLFFRYARPKQAL